MVLAQHLPPTCQCGLAGNSGIGVLPLSESLTKDSFIGGVYAGYNWQVNRWVVGLEGDATFLNGTASNTQTVLATFSVPLVTQGPFQINSHTDWLATIRGRVGYTWDRLMVYGTGGAAWTQTSYTTTFSAAPLGTSAIDTGSFNQNKVGFAVGGGLEWMATRNWLLRAEYLYYRFDASSGNLPVIGPGCTPATCSFGSSSGALQFQTVRVGVSYKFGGPVVAKY